MTLHTDLPIYKKGCALVQLAFQDQEQAAIARALLKRGHAVDGDLTRTFRRTL